MFTELIREDVMGICLNEVGNMSELLTETAQQRFDEVVREAFQAASATEYGEPQIFWS